MRAGRPNRGIAAGAGRPVEPGRDEGAEPQIARPSSLLGYPVGCVTAMPRLGGLPQRGGLVWKGGAVQVSR